NYANTVQALRILADPEGMAIPARRITLSTAGLASGIRRLAQEPVRPRLAVSLNATTDSTRSRLMPINRKFPLHDLLDACRAYPLPAREWLTFEYVLLAGINDGAEDPRRLAALLRRHHLRAKVNLIPFNAGSGLPYREPAAETVRRFQESLLALGIPASIRKNRGRDISAACGQLALAG
ncbi:MAG: 23S rRNA (adenine(2503)-C(2))-methyltransferase RlmN, partial [Acidobacteriota bacterium]